MSGQNVTIAAVIDSSGAVTGANRFNAALGSMRNNANSTGNVIGSLTSRFTPLIGVLGSLAGALSAKQFIEAGDAFIQTKSRLALFAQEGVTATSILDALTGAAARARAPVGQLADMYSRNAAALNVMGLSTSEQVRLSETLYKALVVSGNATESGRQAIIQFSQSLNSGQFRGQEFNSVNEQATEIIRILARETGKTQGELRKLANDGALTAQVAVNALLNGSKDLDAQFQKLPQTVTQASTRLSDMFSLMVGQSADATGSNKALAEAIGEWTKLITADSFQGAIDFFSNGLKNVAEWAGNAAKEIHLVTIEQQLLAEEQAKAAQVSDSAWGRFKTGAGIVAQALLSPQTWYEVFSDVASRLPGGDGIDRKGIREKAQLMADWQTTTTKADAIGTPDANAPKRSIVFGNGETEEEVKRRERLVAQLQKQIDVEKVGSEIMQAQIAGDTTQAQLLQTQLEIRQKISEDMRKASPEKAAALEKEIALQNALKIQLKAVQEIQQRNNAFANDFASAITSAFGSAIKGGQSFSQILKGMAADLLDVITKAAILEPLGRSIGTSLSGMLNGSGSGGFDIGGLFSGAFGGSGIGPFTTTVTPFASGGVVDKPTGFAFSGGMGVAGEAGPEAILPLKRGPNGDMGISAAGLGASNVTTVQITITGDATEATIAKMRQAAEELFAQKTPGIIDQSAGEVAKRYRNNKNYLVR